MPRAGAGAGAAAQPVPRRRAARASSAPRAPLYAVGECTDPAKPCAIP